MIFDVTLTLNFQGQIWNLLYLSQKWSDCHETKSKHINWIQGLKYDHQVWPWPWPWPWIFKVKCWICYISAKNGPVGLKRKANISIELQVSNVTNGFWPWPWHWPLNFQGDLDLWPHAWPWPRIFMVKFWNRCISEWEGRLTLNKGGGSRSFMTMTVTISLPRIYQIVTRVTSDADMLSTHLVDDMSALIQVMAWCRKATSHFLSQCWPRSILPYAVTRPDDDDHNINEDDDDDDSYDDNSDGGWFCNIVQCKKCGYGSYSILTNHSGLLFSQSLGQSCKCLSTNEATGNPKDHGQN